MNAEGSKKGMERAIAFLRRQLAAGRYGLSCFGTDGTPRFSHDKGHVFAGFFIAEALADLMTELERTMLLVRILSEENNGLWGYSPPAPYVGPEHEVFVVDADDTAYVLRTLRRLNVNRSPERLLAFYRKDARLFSTFNAQGETRLAIEPGAARNLLAHPEVNANVFKALLGTNLESFINYDLVRKAQADDGHWHSYFYPGALFGTYLFLDLIRDREALADARQRGIAFVVRSQNADGSWGTPPDVYDTALAANALAVCGEFGEPLTRGIAFLLDRMEAEGSWCSARCIWEFHADEADVWKAYDTNGVVTSALGTLALRRAAAGGYGR